jgi:hypothetical protein
MLQCKKGIFCGPPKGIYGAQSTGRDGAAGFSSEDTVMSDKSTQNRANIVGPVGAVATVPGEFVSVAIFEAVQGMCRLAGKVASGLRRA